MRIFCWLFLIVLPVFTTAQDLLRCNDSISFYVNQKDNYYCMIKLTGKVQNTENDRVFVINNNTLQAMLVDKDSYLGDGTADIPVLSNYILSEMEYFSGLYKEKLYVTMIPVDGPGDRKAIVWYFDIPENARPQETENTSPAVKIVSVSMVTERYIYSIGTTQFKDQSFDELQKLLTDSLITIRYGSGHPDIDVICN